MCLYLFQKKKYAKLPSVKRLAVSKQIIVLALCMTAQFTENQLAR